MISFQEAEKDWSIVVTAHLITILSNRKSYPNQQPQEAKVRWRVETNQEVTMIKMVVVLFPYNWISILHWERSLFLSLCLRFRHLSIVEALFLLQPAKSKTIQSKAVTHWPSNIALINFLRIVLARNNFTWIKFASEEKTMTISCSTQLVLTKGF